MIKRLFLFISFLWIGGCLYNQRNGQDPEDVVNDVEIIRAIALANSGVLNPDPYLYVEFNETGQEIVSGLRLSNLGLNDTNFFFPLEISGFRVIRSVWLTNNDFTMLPRGIQNYDWELGIDLRQNAICDPDSATAAYLNGNANWSDQRCTVSSSEDDSFQKGMESL